MAHVITGRHKDGSGPWFVASVCENTLMPTLWVKGTLEHAHRFGDPVEAAAAETAWARAPQPHIIATRVEQR